MKKCVIGVTAVMLSACSAPMSSVFNRSVVEDEAKHHTALALTGERRLAVFVDQDKQGRFCAEALPDTASSVDAASKAALEITATAATGDSGSGEGSFDDSFRTALLLTNQRTENSDIIRQLGWLVCQAYLNEGIKDAFYQDQITALVAGSIEVMKKNQDIKLAEAQAAAAQAKGDLLKLQREPVPKK